MEKLWVCERADEDILIFEDFDSGESTELKRREFPAEAREGDFFRVTLEAGIVVCAVRDDDTGKRILEENRTRLAGLFDE